MVTFEEKLRDIVEGFTKDLRQSGIYVNALGSGVHHDDDVNPELLEDMDSAIVEDLLSADRVRVIGNLNAELGEFVWEDRNLFPEKFQQEEDLSESLMLDEEDIARATFDKSAEDWWDED